MSAPPSAPADAAFEVVRRWPPSGVYTPQHPGNMNPRARQRASERRELVEQHRARGEMQSYLESTRVSETTREDYRWRALLILIWIQFHRLAFDGFPNIDVSILAWLDAGFACGDHVSEANKTVAALIFFFPSVMGKSGSKLVRSMAAIKSWSLKDKSSSKSPLLWEGACAVAVVLSSGGYPDVSIIFLIMFDILGRPTETILLRLLDVVRPQLPNFRTCGVKLNPFDQGRPSKTEYFDEFIQLTEGPRSAVSALLLWWLPIAQRRGQTRICERSYAEVSRLVQAAGRAAGLHLTLYDARHGGASHCVCPVPEGLGWPLPRVQERGRWAVFDSVLRFQKPALVQEAWSKLSPRVAAFIRACAANLIRHVTAGTCPPLPGL